MLIKWIFSTELRELGGVRVGVLGVRLRKEALIRRNNALFRFVFFWIRDIPYFFSVFLRVPARRLFGADAPSSLRTGTRKKTLKN